MWKEFHFVSGLGFYSVRVGVSERTLIKANLVAKMMVTTFQFWGGGGILNFSPIKFIHKMDQQRVQQKTQARRYLFFLKKYDYNSILKQW
ncbi:hypothetical protein VNO77_23605 [Canavalia gladiata]|uniref:Uncharacterized protein n=1 Tax=Canavalia gladiata TaxID=3824 RepID=A0AAN9QBN4_CANGL